MNQTSSDRTLRRFKIKEGKEKKRRLRRSYFSSLEHSLIRCLRRWLRQKDEGHRNRMGRGPKGRWIAPWLCAARRCSVTGYIPGIPRGHGHISSSSRFPVPHTPGLPTPSRGTQAGTRNNGARVGTGSLVGPLNFPHFGFWFTSTSRRSAPGCKWPERKSRRVQSIRTFSSRVIIVLREPMPTQPSWYRRRFATSAVVIDGDGSTAPVHVRIAILILFLSLLTQ